MGLGKYTYESYYESRAYIQDAVLERAAWVNENTNALSSENEIEEVVANIINELNLKSPMYKGLAAYGHMGREDLNISFEQLDKLEKIKEVLA